MIKTSALSLVIFMTFVNITGALRIFRNNDEISREQIPKMEGLRDLFRAGNNDLVYIEGTRTYDTLRYGDSGGQLPFNVTFTDR